MPPRFYCAEFSARNAVIAGDELHHLRDVRRLGVGDAVELFDGKGRLAECSVRHIDRRGAEFQVHRVTEVAAPRGGLALATAMPKGGRMDWLVEKVTELGIVALWPLVTERGAVSAPGDEKQRGWHRRAVEAAKQCRRLWLPEILQPMSVADAIAQVNAHPPDLVLLADLSADARAAGQYRGEGVSAIVGFVGPEGGFTDEERASLRAAGARPVRLASNVLRIETAAVALAAVLAPDG